MNRLLQGLPILVRVWVYALLVGTYSCLAVWKEHSQFRESWDQPAEIHEMFGVVLGLLLVFRINRTYERWWEARTLWGALVNTSRNQAIKITSLVHPPASDRRQVESIVIGIPYALMYHLRNGCQLIQVPGFESSVQTPQHVPAYLVSLLYDFFHKWQKSELISDDELRILDREASNVLEIVGGCERIRSTLISSSYRRFIRQLIFLHLATVPWGLVDQFGDMTVMIVTIEAYFMIGIEAIAHAIEEPFGIEEDDLALNTLCEKIKVSVSEIFAR